MTIVLAAIAGGLAGLIPVWVQRRRHNDSSQQISE